MELLNVILCDDDPVFLASFSQNVQALLEKHHFPARVRTFCGNTPIPDTLLRRCDIAFLDIDFPRQEQNGMDIARSVRNVNSRAAILFVTNFVEFAREGYEVQAFRYLLKKELPHKLEESLLQALKHLHVQSKTYAIQISGEKILLPIRDILYFEAQKHTLIAYVRKDGGIKPYRFYASLKNAEAELEADGFLRVQKSYLVNMRHIAKYQVREVTLTGGISLPASPALYAEQKQKYLYWKGRQ